jgi:drug/metabolite transporter (DMT)-like permease
MHNSLLYLITVLIWGSTWLAIKFQLGVVSPELSIAYRFGLAAAILFIFSILRRLPLRFSLRVHGFMALQGLFLFSVNYFLIYLAEVYITGGLAAIIFSMIVILNVIFGAVFLHNRVRIGVVIGAVAGLFGLTLVFWPELSVFSLSSQRTLGLILAFLGTTSASLGNIISARNQRNGLPVLQVNAFGMAYGAVFMLLLALFRGAEFNFDTSLSYVISLLFLAIFGSVVAFSSYLTLLGRIGPDRAAYVSVLFPIIALALSTLFEGMTWSLLQLAGIAFVILGNVIVLTNIRELKLVKILKKRYSIG